MNEVRLVFATWRRSHYGASEVVTGVTVSVRPGDLHDRHC